MNKLPEELKNRGSLEANCCVLLLDRNIIQTLYRSQDSGLLSVLSVCCVFVYFTVLVLLFSSAPDIQKELLEEIINVSIKTLKDFSIFTN